MDTADTGTRELEPTKPSTMTTNSHEAGTLRDGSLQLGPRTLPPLAGASDVPRDSVAASDPADRKHVGPIPQTVDEWLAFVAAAAEQSVPAAHALAETLPATVEHDEIPGGAGGEVHHVVPDENCPAHEEHLSVHVHGGAFMLNGGPASTMEPLLLATGIGIRAVSIDYRMPPLHPYPVPVDDVIAVYLELLQQHRCRPMLMGGSSGGTTITMAAVQRLLRDGLRPPGTLFLGTPGCDLTGVGDSIHTNHDVDRNIPVRQGLITSMSECCADGIDPADPRISPLYGDFDGSPSALLVAGVRDILPSNTVRAHTKLLEAGTEADLLVFEGHVARGLRRRARLARTCALSPPTRPVLQSPPPGLHPPPITRRDTARRRPLGRADRPRWLDDRLQPIGHHLIGLAGGSCRRNCHGWTSGAPLFDLWVVLGPGGWLSASPPVRVRHVRERPPAQDRATVRRTLDGLASRSSLPDEGGPRPDRSEW